MKRRLLFLLPLLLIGGCTKIYQEASKDSNANPVAPTPQVVTHLVEFRVTGTVTSANITDSNTEDGSESISTSVPWFRQFKISSDSFLYLDAQSFDFGQLHVQIFVDGQLFKEAFANGSEPRVAVSGTYRF